MDVNLGRMKKWDWGVIGAFVVTIVGVSIPWWKAKIAQSLGDALGGLGDALGGLTGGVPGLTDMPSFNALGWDIDAGVAAFCFALFGALWVAAKIFLPANKPLPKWYMEAWVVLGFGGIMTLCGFIGCVDAPYGGFDTWAWRPGSLITLLAGLGVLFCGYMMLKDKSGDFGQSKVPKINLNVIKADGTTTQVGGATPPAGGAPKFCVGCGAPLDAGAAACKSCGKQA
jgi:hypothetical protein